MSAGAVERPPQQGSAATPAVRPDGGEGDRQRHTRPREGHQRAHGTEAERAKTKRF